MDWLKDFFLFPENMTTVAFLLFLIRKTIAFIGTIIIFTGAISAFVQFFGKKKNSNKSIDTIDTIRLKFGRTIILGLEFIVASDVIATTTTPDYYSVGILAALVGIRTILTFFMNRELLDLSKNRKA